MTKPIAFVAVLASACAPFVQFAQMGPDTYSVETGQSFYGQQQAGAYCAHQGKQVLITNTQQRFDGATTVFRCLIPGDKDYQRPVYESPPAAVIEDRRR
jgi:hypothetical protein